MRRKHSTRTKGVITVELTDVAEQVRANWNDPDWWRHVASPFAIQTAILSPYFRYIDPSEGVDFMAEDWDNLIILDACRYDLFAEVYEGPGRLETRRSIGSNTPEFLTRTFDGRTFEDTVYVTANPQVNVHTEGAFHAVVNAWESAWDEELNTVPPDAMADATLEAYERFPDKRLISHFVQPHYPFVGEYAREHLGDQAGIEFSKRLASEDDRPTEHDHIWLRLRAGRVDEDVVRRAYRENLEVTVPHVHRLLETFAEPTVVTSDHGNSFGTRATPFRIPIWGHPPGVYIPELVTVPWLEVEGTRRKDVTADPPTESYRTDEETVDDRLRHLGYVS